MKIGEQTRVLDGVRPAPKAETNNGSYKLRIRFECPVTLMGDKEIELDCQPLNMRVFDGQFVDWLHAEFGDRYATMVLDEFHESIIKRHLFKHAQIVR